MKSNLIITVTGDLGSGKSKISKLLAKKLSYKVYSTGDLQRKIAQRKKMTTLDLNYYSESNPEVDVEIDGFTKNLHNSKENLIVDSRLAWFFIPFSFKIYLSLSTELAAQRIFQDKERKNEQYQTLAETRLAIEKRRKSEIARFKKLYNINLINEDNYDLLVNTAKVSAEETAEKIIEIIGLKKGNLPFPAKLFF